MSRKGGTGDPEAAEAWSEEDSAGFLDHGRHFVPERETQIETICAAVPATPAAVHLVELRCGEGLLSRALLERLPGATLHAFDGSPAMLEAAGERCAAFGGRFEARAFDLATADWRAFPWPLHAAVSSLAIHHLDGPQKQQLFADIAAALAPGGVFVIADLIAPPTPEGRALAAQAWDHEVRRRALEIDGNLGAYEDFLDENWNYHSDPLPDPLDKPSRLLDQLNWLEAAGLEAADVHWLKAGHAIFSARKPAP